MRILYDRRVGMERVILEPGEYHTAHTSRAISTVLGSCVSVCIKCEASGLAGMNHFMLPAAVDEKRLFTSDAGRYGIHAMELLINELLERGARRAALWAKAFGAGHVLDIPGAKTRVSDANALFTRRFLEMEGIPLRASDLGGRRGRRVTFFTDSGMVRVKLLARHAQQEVHRLEDLHQRHLNDLPSTGRVFFFQPGGGT